MCQLLLERYPEGGHPIWILDLVREARHLRRTLSSGRRLLDEGLKRLGQKRAKTGLRHIGAPGRKSTPIDFPRQCGEDASGGGVEPRNQERKPTGWDTQTMSMMLHDEAGRRDQVVVPPATSVVGDVRF